MERVSGFDINRALAEIAALSGKKIQSNSLIFFDEVQESKYAYERLRYIHEQRPEDAV